MKIRLKLTLLLLTAGLLPTVAVATASYISIGNDLKNKVADQLVSIAAKQAQEINGLLQAKQEEVTKLANQYDFQVDLGRYLADGDKPAHDGVVAILQKKQATVSDIQAIYVADLSGTVVASTVASAEKQLLPAQANHPQSGEQTTTTVREDPRDGLNKLYITTTIGINKKDAARLSVIFRIDDIIATAQDYTGLGATGETIVAERTAQGQDGGGHSVSLLPLRFNTDAALVTHLDQLHLFEAAATDGYQPGIDYRNQPVFVAPRLVGFADWAIATKIDQREALAPIIQLRNALLVIGLLSSAVIVVAAVYISRLFSEPILRIARASQLIGQGDFTTALDIKTNDEIGVLGKSINSMEDSLRRMVASLEAQRNRLQIILNSTAEGIVAIDQNGTVVIANRVAAELAGARLEALVGQPIHSLFSWQRQGQPLGIDYGAPGLNTYTDIEYSGLRGAKHYIKLVVAQVTSQQDQQAAQTIITIHDQTKSRELEAMKVDFVSMAAHELRTPLAAIRGYLELINFGQQSRKAGKPTTAELSGYLNRALAGTSELGSLINNLLSVSRIERGALNLNPEVIDLAVMAANAVQEMRFTAQDKDIQLNYDGPPDGCLVQADQVALREVVNNLLSNALKYTQRGGQVTVRLSCQASKYCLQVRDNGIGIPKAAMANLFTKFYRVHGGLNSGSTGTGLGLFISKSIIERHHGTISVESTEGEGSTFSFSLPVAPQKSSVSGRPGHSGKALKRRMHGWVTKNITR